MDPALNDKRFSNVAKDPKFRRVPSSTRKVSIDKRFNGMFRDKRFKLKYSVDKRGKPINLTSSEQLKNFYDIESDEEDSHDGEKEVDVPSTRPSTSNHEETVGGFKVTRIEKGQKSKLALEEEIPEAIRTKLQDMSVDYARGEGCLLTDSSSEEEDSSEEEPDSVYHDWGELDKDAEETDTATRRLAVCNMDWDRIRAVDLMVLLNSFAPQGGAVQSVTIYPSEFGLQRMKEEEILGPKELVETKCVDEEDGDDEEIDEYHREKLRQYQLNRLKYYYAVVDCDSDTTAGKIYEECDGHEFESSAARLDLRFIPDDMTFDQEPKDVCTAMPDASQYEPRIFMNSALQQAQVHLTWDETDPTRMQTMQKLFQGKKGKQKDGLIDEDAIKGLVATSSEEEDEDEVEVEKPREAEEEANDQESCLGESERIAKYRNLLANLTEQEEKAKRERRGNGDMEMEITWGVGLKEKAQQLVKEKLAEKSAETAWEQQLAKRREKRMAKRKEKKEQQRAIAPPSDEEDDDIPSDVDMDDPYFREELEKDEFRPKKKKPVTEEEPEEDEGKSAELELLLMDENDGKRHFSLKSIMKEEGVKSGKGASKKKGKPTDTACSKDDFKIQVEDPRFSALFTSHHFNLDPSDPNFKPTEGTQAILQEKQKRRLAEDTQQDSSSKSDQPEEKKASISDGKDPELARLVRSVKIKTSMQKNQQKYKSSARR